MLLILIASATTAKALPPGSQTVCSGLKTYSVTRGIAAPGSTLLWSVSPAGGWAITSTNTESTIITWGNPAITTVYTITLTETDNTTSCSTVKTVIVTVNPAPVAPTSGGNQTVCQQSPIQTLTATATVPGTGTVVWYDAATAGNIVASPIKNTTGSVTYYAQNNDGCSSLTRTAVTLTITPAPVAPTASDQSDCSDGTGTQTLTATAIPPVGSNVVWYNAPTGGSIVTTPTRVGVGSVTYYSESVTIVGGCSSLTRKAVTLTINSLPNTSNITFD